MPSLAVQIHVSRDLEIFGQSLLPNDPHNRRFQRQHCLWSAGNQPRVYPIHVRASRILLAIEWQITEWISSWTVMSLAMARISTSVGIWLIRLTSGPVRPILNRD